MLQSLSELYKKHLLYINGITRLEQSLIHIHNKEYIQTTLAALRKHYVMDAAILKQIESLQKSAVKRWAIERLIKR